jgi:hypothetical protein
MTNPIRRLKSLEKSGPPARLSGDAAADHVETARYIASLSSELAGIARTSRLDLLAYFLDMARLEAISIAKAGKRQR